MRDLNRLYREEPALWELDSDPSGFWWLEPNDADANVVAFARASSGCPARQGWSCSSPTSPRCRASDIGSACRRACRWREALNTDSTFYGGSDVGNLGSVEPDPIPWHDQPVSAEVTLPPLAAIWLVPEE